VTDAPPRVRATIVGSLPKRSWLAKPGELFPPWRLDSAILEEGKEDAVRLWVTAQETVAERPQAALPPCHCKHSEAIPTGIASSLRFS
jgi:hypothetical protein